MTNVEHHWMADDCLEVSQFSIISSMDIPRVTMVRNISGNCSSKNSRRRNLSTAALAPMLTKLPSPLFVTTTS